MRNDKNPSPIRVRDIRRELCIWGRLIKFCREFNLTDEQRSFIRIDGFSDAVDCFVIFIRWGLAGFISISFSLGSEDSFHYFFHETILTVDLVLWRFLICTVDNLRGKSYASSFLLFMWLFYWGPLSHVLPSCFPQHPLSTNSLATIRS